VLYPTASTSVQARDLKARVVAGAESGVRCQEACPATFVLRAQVAPPSRGARPVWEPATRSCASRGCLDVPRPGTNPHPHPCLEGFGSPFAESSPVSDPAVARDFSQQGFGLCLKPCESAPAPGCCGGVGRLIFGRGMTSWKIRAAIVDRRAITKPPRKPPGSGNPTCSSPFPPERRGCLCRDFVYAVRRQLAQVGWPNPWARRSRFRTVSTRYTCPRFTNHDAKILRASPPRPRLAADRGASRDAGALFPPPSAS